MHLNYSQTTGQMTTDDGADLAHCWAGHGDSKNNPADQAKKSVGPLPQGLYTVQGWFAHPRLGPLVAKLTQIEGETFGRDAFYIHGPSKDPAEYGQESKGCIVIPRIWRQRVSDLTQGEGHTLSVTA